MGKKVENLGAGEILLTSMDKDGTKSGFDLLLTKRVSSSVDIPVIASGGIGEINHFVDGVKKEVLRHCLLLLCFILESLVFLK